MTFLRAVHRTVGGVYWDGPNVNQAIRYFLGYDQSDLMGYQCRVFVGLHDPVREPEIWRRLLCYFSFFEVLITVSLQK